jgi:hypothetical protein
MPRTIGCLGYVGRPNFEYDCLSDQRQIESMLAARDDRIIMTHWDDVDAQTLVTRAWDLRAGSWGTEDYTKCDAFMILEAPSPGSKNADFAHADTAMREILRLGIPAVNSIRTFLEYADKWYLAKRSDMPFPKTYHVTRDTDLSPLLVQLPDEVVVKPVIGCGGKGVMRLPRDAEAIRNALESGRDYLLQEFCPEILEGEKSLYFYAKKFRYAVIKRPNPGEFRANEEHSTGACYEPTGDELSLAEEAIARFASPSLIERVDMTSRHVIEMTIECPGLRLKTCNVLKEAGYWTYEAIDMAIARGY